MLSNNKWIKIILIAAGISSIVWGLFTLFFQSFFFNLIEMKYPEHLIIWRTSGIISMVMGIGYLIASSNALRYWPIVIMGLLIKILLPLSFGISFINGEIPFNVFKVGTINHLIWLIPFLYILYQIYMQPYIEDREIIKYASEEKEISLHTYNTNRGRSIHDASFEGAKLLVFLRHFGCTFCKETLSEIKKNISKIEERGSQVILVHMVSEDKANENLKLFNLLQLEHVSDPESMLYKGFNLKRGTFTQLFGLKVWIRGFFVGIIKKHGIGKIQGDQYQMPGIFLIYHGEVIKEFYHDYAGDIPPYLDLSTHPF